MYIGIEFEGIKNHIYDIDNEIRNLRKLREVVYQKIQFDAAITGVSNVTLEQNLMQIAKLEDSFLGRIQFLEQLVEDFQMIEINNHALLNTERQATNLIDEW